MMELKLYYCPFCKKIVEYVNDAPTTTICCGQPMLEIKANTTEAAFEKHLPVIEKDGNTVTVKVGEVTHPMLDEHFITHIWLETDMGMYRKSLIPDTEPKAIFVLGEGEEVVAAYEYCNLHGLWKTEA